MHRYLEVRGGTHGRPRRVRRRPAPVRPRPPPSSEIFPRAPRLPINTNDTLSNPTRSPPRAALRRVEERTSFRPATTQKTFSHESLAAWNPHRTDPHEQFPDGPRGEAVLAEARYGPPRDVEGPRELVRGLNARYMRSSPPSPSPSLSSPPRFHASKHCRGGDVVCQDGSTCPKRPVALRSTRTRRRRRDARGDV